MTPASVNVGVEISFWGSEKTQYSPENERMSPENQWLVQIFLLKGCLYLGDMLVFGGVTVENEGIIPLMEYPYHPCMVYLPTFG